jgi:hypothetical protein
MTTTAAAPATEGAWALGFMKYLGDAPSGLEDPGVLFLEGQESDEGTFEEGNIYNPLDSTEQEGNSPAWNTFGDDDHVWQYGTLLEGYVGDQTAIGPELTALKSPARTRATLEAALGQSDVTGEGAGSSAQEAYAANVASLYGQNETAPLTTVQLTGWSKDLKDISGALGSVIPGASIVGSAGDAAIGAASSALGVSASDWKGLIYTGLFIVGGLGIIGIGIAVLTKDPTEKAAEAAAPLAAA